jgi:hypothetical protein
VSPAVSSAAPSIRTTHYNREQSVVNRTSVGPQARSLRMYHSAKPSRLIRRMRGQVSKPIQLLQLPLCVRTPLASGAWSHGQLLIQVVFKR